MRSLTFWLIFIGITVLSSASVIQERSKRAIVCANRIPLADYFEHGYDVTEYDVFACPELGGKRAKIIQVNTCDNGAKFKYSNDEKTAYDVPDHIYKFYDSPHTRLTAGHTYSRKSVLKENYLKGTLFESFSDSIEGTEKAMFKNSPFWNEMANIFAKNSKLALVFYKVTIYGAVLPYDAYEKASFTPEFTADVNALPEKLEGNEKAYLDFLEKYGTHVLWTAKFGAIIYKFAEIPSSKHEQESEFNWEMIKDMFALNDTLDILCEQKTGPRQSMKVYAKNRDNTQVIVGGYANRDFYQNETIPLNAISSSPAMVSSEVRPISIVFTKDANKKQNIENSIKIYMAKAYIRSKVSSIQLLLDNGREKKLTTTALLKRAKQSENVYKVEELNKLGNDLIEEMFRL